MDAESLIALGVFVALNFAAASSGAVFQPGPWYDDLRKPAWRPPNWLFGPVWAVLYCMIAASGWLVWREVGLAGGALPLGLYFVQLCLNAAWSGIFFGLHRLGLAAIEMALLWLAIAATIAAFAPIHALAAWLLAPYLVWVSFAFVLNFSVWRLNRATA